MDKNSSINSIAYFIFSIVILLQLASCNFKQLSPDTSLKNIPIKENRVSIEFDILQNIDDKVRMLEWETIWSDYKMLATVKQINTSDTIVEILKPAFIINENFEIKNLKGERVDSLISENHYQFLIDPGTYEMFNKPTNLKPKEFSIDTINFASDFKFNTLIQPDTFLIRVKNFTLEKNSYSNWDTLIID